METVSFSYSWPEPDIDVLRLFVVPESPRWLAEFVDGNPLIAVLREVDEHWQETGRIAGVEIVGFSTFSDWGSLPHLPFRWRLSDHKASLDLSQLLNLLQSRIRDKSTVRAGA